MQSVTLLPPIRANTFLIENNRLYVEMLAYPFRGTPNHGSILALLEGHRILAHSSHCGHFDAISSHMYHTSESIIAEVSPDVFLQLKKAMITDYCYSVGLLNIVPKAWLAAANQGITLLNQAISPTLSPAAP